MVETDRSILLVDPWVEGFAFDKGWALLDSSTSNEELIDFLLNLGKSINIWYSHEHSDHFSVPFLKGLEKRGLKARVFFQKTLDGRVANFIRKQNFSVYESNDKLEKIDQELSLVTFPFAGGDSYCLVLVNGYSILNMNDCVISTDAAAARVSSNCRKHTENIDLLLTQFGYANWIGNESEKGTRLKSAEEKLSSIKLQVEAFSPSYVIPFASFVYFCHPENFYMNDAQNSPKSVYDFLKSKELPADLIVLKPWDELNLPINSGDHIDEKLVENIKHWEDLLASCTRHDIQDPTYTEGDIFTQYTKYRAKVFKSFLFLPKILEITKFLPSLTIFVKDLNLTYRVSYLSGIRRTKGCKEDANIALSSATLMFILKNEYGANTTKVNGKFEQISKTGHAQFSLHFSPQEYMKNGYGLKHPIVSMKIIIGKLMKAALNKN